MKLYTRGGDSGETSLFGGERVRKCDARIEAYGAVDEANSTIGVALVELSDPDLRECLREAQVLLFDIGAELASPASAEPSAGGGRSITPKVGKADIEACEAWIDRFVAETTPLRTFVLPGGTRAASQLHVARTVCRRAERRVVELAAHAHVSGRIIEYLNRLSDLLFALARAVNARAGVEEPLWIGRERARGDDAG